ncbi:MAG: Minicollagen 3 [Parcubacteria group bacterium GW2011_GWB1_40_14]|nr:MAG: Minicollagen 3 [Parcubacteria group bacterium GW2011_GWB1_40_14]
MLKSVIKYAWLETNKPLMFAAFFAIPLAVFIFTITKIPQQITPSVQAAACTTSANCTDLCSASRDSTVISKQCISGICQYGYSSCGTDTYYCVGNTVYYDNYYCRPANGTCGSTIANLSQDCTLKGQICSSGLCVDSPLPPPPPPPGPPGPPIPPGGGDCGDYTNTGYPAFIGPSGSAEGCNTQDSRYGIGPYGERSWTEGNIRHYGLEPGCVRGHTTDTTDGCYSGHYETLCTSADIDSSSTYALKIPTAEAASCTTASDCTPYCTGDNSGRINYSCVSGACVQTGTSSCGTDRYYCTGNSVYYDNFYCRPANGTCGTTTGNFVGDCTATGQICSSGACVGGTVPPPPPPPPPPGGTCTDVFVCDVYWIDRQYTCDAWSCEKLCEFTGGKETAYLWDRADTKICGCGRPEGGILLPGPGPAICITNTDCNDNNSCTTDICATSTGLCTNNVKPGTSYQCDAAKRCVASDNTQYSCTNSCDPTERDACGSTSGGGVCSTCTKPDYYSNRGHIRALWGSNIYYWAPPEMLSGSLDVNEAFSSGWTGAGVNFVYTSDPNNADIILDICDRQGKDPRVSCLNIDNTSWWALAYRHSSTSRMCPTGTSSHYTANYCSIGIRKNCVWDASCASERNISTWKAALVNHETGHCLGLRDDPFDRDILMFDGGQPNTYRPTTCEVNLVSALKTCKEDACGNNFR